MKTNSLLVVLLAVCLGAVGAAAQPRDASGRNSTPPPNDFEPKSAPQNLNADGPWNRDVIAYRVSSSGAVEKAATFERAGVPTIARLKDGRLIVAHQHFPENDRENFDKVAVHFSGDDGRTWGAAQVIQVAGLPEGMRFPFDPTLVPLPDGRVRLYFTGNMGRTFQRSTPAIHSAISSDGVNYTYEQGVRFAVEGRAVIDCAVVLHAGVFHLYAPDNGVGQNPGQRPDNRSAEERPRQGVGYHATSSDGLSFTREPDVRIEGRRSWLGNAQSDGKLITFYGTGEGMGTDGGRPRGAFWMATTADGRNWNLVKNPPVAGADPGAAATRDGGLLVVATGESRLRAPGAGPYPPPRREQNPDARASAPGSRPDGTLDLAMMWSQGRAVGKGTVRFTHSPMRIEDIKTVVPYGMMVGGHVCPIDHGYFYPKPLQPGKPHFDVLAPADGFIVTVAHRTQLTGSSERAREYDDYALTIEHSGTFYTQYDLLTSLDKSVLDQLDASVRERFEKKQMGPPVRTRIAVKAGQVVGKVGGRSLDFGVVNTEVRLPGFLTPKLYGNYAWRVHVVDPFDFFDEPLKSKLLALNVRKVKPWFGKIDYDVDGRLIGNWFREGSGGYDGDRRDPRGYWMGHLAFAYHHIDPTKIVVSIGDYDGKPRQFWVKGNAPDPVKIGEADGVVKYELIWGQLGSSGDRQLMPDAGAVQGTVLARVLPGRKLKFEVFPGRTASEVSIFTTAARVYER